MTCFLLHVKFWQMDHVFAKFASAIFSLICYCACAEMPTVVLLALTLHKIKFSVPGFIHNLAIYSRTVVRQLSYARRSYAINTAPFTIHEIWRTYDWRKYDRKSATYLHMWYDHHRRQFYWLLPILICIKSLLIHEFRKNTYSCLRQSLRHISR